MTARLPAGPGDRQRDDEPDRGDQVGEELGLLDRLRDHRVGDHREGRRRRDGSDEDGRQHRGADGAACQEADPQDDGLRHAVEQGTAAGKGRTPDPKAITQAMTPWGTRTVYATAAPRSGAAPAISPQRPAASQVGMWPPSSAGGPRTRVY